MTYYSTEKNIFEKQRNSESFEKTCQQEQQQQQNKISNLLNIQIVDSLNRDKNIQIENQHVQNIIENQSIETEETIVPSHYFIQRNDSSSLRRSQGDNICDILAMLEIGKQRFRTTAQHQHFVTAPYIF